jgi:hypothetical protein
MKRILLVVFVLSMGNLAWAQSTPPPNGSWQSFAILGTTVTNTGATIVRGDLGVTSGTAVTGFPPGILSGGMMHSNDAEAVSARADAMTAWSALRGEPCGGPLSDFILGTTPGAVILTPGVYCFAGPAQLTGTLTLDGPGVYVFQVGTTLTTASSSSVVLANGATAENVFWQVGSAILGANTAFVGSIFTFTSDTVTVTAGSSVAGRVLALNGAVTLDTNTVTESNPVAGRWEIVHTSGDSPAQTALFPGGFSTFLLPGGTGYTFGTFANSICVIDDEAFNVVPTWVGWNDVQITITVDNLGAAPDFSIVYSGKYVSSSIPGDPTMFIPTITGTYVPTGGAPGCSNGAGTFVATFLPTISSGSANGSLDATTPGTTGATGFTSPVNATVNFGTPPSPGQVNGTVSLDSNPTFGGKACFATSMTDGTGPVNPLTINPSLSAQSGIILQMRAEGRDPSGAATTLELDGYSANLYFTDTNTDPTANQIAIGEWAAGAAIGEDNPDPSLAGAGVVNDGTNSAIVLFYGVVGGACNGAGGADAPFHFVSRKPHIQGHRKHSRRGRSDRDRDRDRDRGRTKVGKGRE